jgi:hypothetical protein
VVIASLIGVHGILQTAVRSAAAECVSAMLGKEFPHLAVFLRRDRSCPRQDGG